MWQAEAVDSRGVFLFLLNILLGTTTLPLATGSPPTGTEGGPWPSSGPSDHVLLTQTRKGHANTLLTAALSGGTPGY